MNKKKKEINNKPNDRLINFYELESFEKFKVKYHNPSYNYQNMNLKHPMRGSIIGASGGGKSTIAVQIIHEMKDTFEKIIIFTRQMEPLYEWLESEIGARHIEIHEGMNHLNNLNIDEDLLHVQTLIIFDDLCLEKNQKAIEELYIRGRKLCGGAGISLLYLSQSYFKIPRVVRLQSDLIILKKLNSNKDLKMIVNDHNLGELSGDDIKHMYEYCISDGFKSFLMINMTDEQNNMFRKNFDVILNIKK